MQVPWKHLGLCMVFLLMKCLRKAAQTVLSSAFFQPKLVLVYVGLIFFFFLNHSLTFHPSGLF